MWVMEEEKNKLKDHSPHPKKCVKMLVVFFGEGSGNDHKMRPTHDFQVEIS